VRAFQEFLKNQPLTGIVLLALVLRLLAAIFAKGYMMHDDHFLIIETSAGWADGYDYNYWLPWSLGNHGPSGHSFFYPGIHFLFFKLFNLAGIADPQTKMLLIRILHALYSLLIVTLGYKIAWRLSDKKTAQTAALVLATLAFMPNFSVRNLVEMVSIPPLMAAVLALMNYEEKGQIKSVFWAGVFVGIAAGIRYQTGLFGAGLGLYLFYKKEWRGAFVLAAGFVFSFFLTQTADLFIWKRPFAELTEYVRYNFTSGGEYIVLPWYTYLLTMVGYLLPPLSLFLLWGFVRNARQHLITFLPVLLFLLVHSLIGNKQERFILPVLPFIIISGIAYWNQQKSLETIRSTGQKLMRLSWVIFWVINGMGLIFLTFSYGKKARVEAMYFLYENEVRTPAVIEYSFRNEIRYPPQFYAGCWEKYVPVDAGTDLKILHQNLLEKPKESRPNYVLFYENESLDKRIENFEKQFGKLQFESKVEPSWFDRLLYRVNSNNRLEEVHIYSFEMAEEFIEP